ncbi:hypothetical protein FACS189430_04170 [Bacteroidia bacterium]|nr:hypothetical protein FACS189430_04170 [Bacteroidia bacterium]
MATQKEIQDFENSVWEKFLTNATPQEIHQSVIDSNWDGNEFLVNWIKNNPNVDKATALIAYWMSAPRWYKQYKDRAEVPSYEIKNFDFVEEVEQKYSAGFWKNSNIELNPKCDCDGFDWTSEYLDKTTVREISTIMYQKLEGEKIDRPDGWEEGLPEKFAQQIHDFLEENDI